MNLGSPLCLLASSCVRSRRQSARKKKKKTERGRGRRARARSRLSHPRGLLARARKPARLQREPSERVKGKGCIPTRDGLQRAKGPHRPEVRRSVCTASFDSWAGGTRRGPPTRRDELGKWTGRRGRSRRRAELRARGWGVSQSELQIRRRPAKSVDGLRWRRARRPSTGDGVLSTQPLSLLAVALGARGSAGRRARRSSRPFRNAHEKYHTISLAMMNAGGRRNETRGAKGRGRGWEGGRPHLDSGVTTTAARSPGALGAASRATVRPAARTHSLARTIAAAPPLQASRQKPGETRRSVRPGRRVSPPFRTQAGSSRRARGRHVDGARTSARRVRLDGPHPALPPPRRPQAPRLPEASGRFRCPSATARW